MREHHKAIVITVTEPLHIRIMEELGDAQRWTIDDLEFRDMTDMAWTGFYDWLRNRDLDVVGVRTWPHAPIGEKLRDALDGNRNVDCFPNEVRIWFSDTRDFSEKNSDDQEVGDHRVFVSENGIIAFSFNIDSLSEQEMARLGALTKSHLPRAGA